jgi:hypothetical protein
MSNFDSPIFVRKLTEADAFLVSNLRQVAYLEAGYVLDPPDKMNWGPSDRRFFVMGAFYKKELVASIRIEVLETEADMQTYAQGLSHDFGVRLPCVSVARATTLGSYRNKGLWKLLRGLAIAWAAQNNFEHSISTFIDSSYIKKTLEEAGYKIASAPPWKDFIKSPEKTSRATLDLNNSGFSAASFLLQSSALFPGCAELETGSLNLNLDPFLKYFKIERRS